MIKSTTIKKEENGLRLLIFFVLLLPNLLQAEGRLFSCNKIFEQRKEELLLELERIDEQQQSIEALKEATNHLLKKREKNNLIQT